MCWWGCQQLSKLSRIQRQCLSPSVLYIDSHTFYASWGTFSNYQNYFQHMHLFMKTFDEKVWWKSKRSKVVFYLDHPFYDVYFLQYHTSAATHFMNHERLCQIIRNIFDIYIYIYIYIYIFVVKCAWFLNKSEKRTKILN